MVYRVKYIFYTLERGALQLPHAFQAKGNRNCVSNAGPQPLLGRLRRSLSKGSSISRPVPDEMRHIGLLETTTMVGLCLGFPIDELRQTKQPLLTKTHRESPFITIESGKACGFKQNVTGLIKGEKILDFKMVGIVSPDKDEDGVEMGDYTRITGEPGRT